MALTNYLAIKPTQSSFSTTDSNLGLGTHNSVYVIGNLNPNDYVLVFCDTYNTSSLVTYDTTPTSPGLVFTKISPATTIGSCWIAKNTTGSSIGSPLVTVTASGATGSYKYVVTTCIVNNATGYAAGTGYTATVAASAIWGSNGLANVPAASLVISYGIAARFASETTMPAIYRAYPSCLAAVQINQSSYCRFNIATSGTEDVPVQSSATDYTVQFIESGAPATTRAVLAQSIVFYGANVTLDDLTYQVDTGPLLNSSDNTFPLYDITDIQGLDDLTITSTSDPVDGSDGSYANAQFATGKTIVIDGTIYSNSPFDPGLIDNLKSCMSPVIGFRSLFYKNTNQNPKKISVKPIACTAPIDRGHAISQVPFQLQLISGEAYSKSIIPKILKFANQSSSEQVLSIYQDGNVEIWPIFYFNVGTSELSPDNNLITFTNYSYSRQSGYAIGPATIVASSVSVNVTPSVGGVPTAVPLTPGAYKLDFKNRQLFSYAGNYGPQDCSSNITTADWWSLLPGQNNIISVAKTVALTDNIWMSAYDGWK